jgi:hypothetical protein
MNIQDYVNEIKEKIVKPCLEYTKAHKACVIVSVVLFVLLILK